MKVAYREKALITFILIGSTGIALTLHSIKKPDSHISLQIQSSAVRCQLAEPWLYTKDSFDIKQPLRHREIVLENRSSTVTVNLPRCGKRNEPSTLNKKSVTIVSDNIQVTELRIDKGTQLEMNLEDGRIGVSMKGGNVSGTLKFKGLASVYEDYQKKQLVCSVGPSQPPSFPETLDFSFDIVGAVPARIVTDRDMFSRLTDLKINELHFSQEEASGMGYDAFQSTIRKGTITVYEASRDYMLRERDRLMVKGLRGKWMNITVGDQLDVMFEGFAKEIKAGPEGFEENLAPSMLEYIYHERTLSLLWGSIVFACALIFGFRKTFFQ